MYNNNTIQHKKTKPEQLQRNKKTKFFEAAFTSHILRDTKGPWRILAVFEQGLSMKQRRRVGRRRRCGWGGGSRVGGWGVGSRVGDREGVMKTQKRVENSESKTTLKAPVSHSLFSFSSYTFFFSQSRLREPPRAEKNNISRFISGSRLSAKSREFSVISTKALALGR